jgi:hypothetical protein
VAASSRSVIETVPPRRTAFTGQVSQSIRQVSTRTVEAPVTQRTTAAPDLSPVPTTPPRDRIVETVTALAAPTPEPNARGKAPLPLIMPPPQPPPPRLVQARTPPPPSFHIGTLEVNVLPPGPTQPTAARAQPRIVRSQSAAGRLARGFGVFGLSQS